MTSIDNLATNPSLSQSTNVAQPPSDTVSPYKVDTLPQQGSTSPGDGGKVATDGHMNRESSHPATAAHPTEKVPFKEQVIGVAQKTRGTIFGDAALKEHGNQILQGNTTHEADRRRDA